MKVICPACRAQVPAEAINIAAMTAVCRGCSEVFALSAVGSGPAPAACPDEASRPRYVVQDELSGGGLRLAWGWWQWSYLFLVCFTAAWDGFLVFWYAAAIGGVGRSGQAMSWFAILFPIAHVAVGVGLTYFLVAALFNRTAIELDGQGLRVRHGPVPWFGNRDIPRDQIRRLKLARTETNHSGRISTTHGLLAELDPGGQSQLIRSFRDGEHARYVGRSLAAAAGVPLVEG